MSIFSVGILYDTACGIARSADTLIDYYGSEVIDELNDYNRVLAESVTPSEPYRLSLSAVREELASSGEVHDPVIALLVV